MSYLAVLALSLYTSRIIFPVAHVYWSNPGEAAARSISPVGGVQPDLKWPDISFSASGQYYQLFRLCSLWRSVLGIMSAQVYERVLLDDPYDAQEAGVKTTSYERCESARHGISKIGILTDQSGRNKLRCAYQEISTAEIQLHAIYTTSVCTHRAVCHNTHPHWNTGMGRDSFPASLWTPRNAKCCRYCSRRSVEKLTL